MPVSTVFLQRLRSIGLLMAALLPCLFIATQAFRGLAGHESGRIDEDLARNAHEVGRAVAQRLDVSLAYLNALAVSDAAQRDDLQAMYDQAQRIMQTLPHASAISLVAEDNRIVFLTLRPFGTQGMLTNETESVATVFKQGKVVLSGPFKSPISDPMIAAVSIPVMRQGKVAYCLRMILRTTALNELLVAQKLPQDWTLAILSAEGTVVARSRTPEAFIGKAARPDLVENLRKSSESVINTSTLEGTPVKALVVRMTSWDWGIAVAVPVSRLVAARDSAYLLIATLCLSVALIGALLGVMIYSNTPRSHAARLSTPEKGTTLSIRGDLSIGILALAIAILLALFTSLATQNGVLKLEERAGQRLASSSLRTQIVHVMSLFQDVETGQRGFAITGRDAFLAPYKHAQDLLPAAMAQLKTALAPLQITGFDWAEMQALATLRLDIAARAIAERREVGDKVVNDTALFEQGRLATEKLRVKFAVLDQFLAQRVDDLTVQLQNQGEKVEQLQWLNTIAGGSLVAIAIGFWWSERNRRISLYQQLLTSHEHMEDRVRERTKELHEATARIRQFASESAHNIESERKRLSREVHDQLGQIFTAIKMIVKTMRPASLPPEQHQALQQAIDLGVRTTRRIAGELRPPLLDDLGLNAALDLYLRTALSGSGVTYTVDIAHEPTLPPGHLTQVFRILQEAVTNVVRHAQATHISVQCSVSDGHWQAVVEDNGVGLHATPGRSGALGIVGMRERADMLGGTLQYEARAEHGTKLVLRIPQQAQVKEAAP